MGPRQSIALALASAALFLLPAAGAAENVGDPSVAACLNAGTAKGACTESDALAGARPLALSPDGGQVYVATSGGTPYSGGTNQPSAVLTFGRDAAGNLSYRAFTTTAAMGNPQDLVVSPDGRNVYVSNAGTNAIAVFNRGADGTLSTSADSITTATGWGQPHGMTISDDGNYVYVSTSSGTLLAFARNASTGALTQLATPTGCYSEAATTGCTTVRGINNRSWQLALSPGGTNLYVTGFTDAYAYYTDLSTCNYAGYFNYTCGVQNTAPASGTTAIFTRDPVTGILSQQASAAACWSNNGTEGGTAGSGSMFGGDPNRPYLVGTAGTPPTADCTNMNQPILAGARTATVSPDGKNLYVGADNGLVTFSRAANGTLTFAGCQRRAGASIDGCTDATGLGSVYRIGITPDQKSLVTSSNDPAKYDGTLGFDFFTRDASTGALAQRPGQAGCLTQNGTNLACAPLDALGDYGSIAFSPDGLEAYTTGQQFGALATLHLDAAPSCTDAAADTAAGTPISIALSCSDANGDPLTRSLAHAPANGTASAFDGSRLTYTPATGFTGADSFTYTATALGVQSAPATVSLNVTASPGGTTPITQTPPTTKPKTHNPVTASWRVKGTRTTARRLRLAKLRKATKVTLSCRGKSCAFKRLTVKAKRAGTLDLLRSLSKHRRSFQAGQRLTIMIAAPKAKQVVVSYTFVKSRKPRVTVS
jgi:hypothetical protein